MAIMVFTSGSVQVLQDFTDDRDAARHHRNADRRRGRKCRRPTTASDTGAAFGQNDGEFNIFYTDRQLAALQTAATMLGRLNEKKSLVYFASGLRLNGVEQPGATARHDQRRDPRRRLVLAGRRARPGGAGAAGRCDARLAGRPGDVHRRGRECHDEQSSALAGHAVGAGRRHRRQGAARLQRPVQGIVQAQKAMSSYYILGYYTTNANLDGKFRKIKITSPMALRPSSITARATTPARSSPSSPPPTKSGSSKTR